jgi:hypothetical protein
MAAARQQSKGMIVGGRVVSLAGRSLCIEANTARAELAIAPAIAHLPGEPRTSGRQTRWTIVEEDDQWVPREFSGTGAYRTQGGGFAVVQHKPPSFESYHPNVGIVLRAAPAALAAGDLRAHPGSYALAAWLSGPSTQVLHAGAIAHEGAAALIVGAGGVGKSTTVLACALAGAGFLGDDLVLVEAGSNNQNAEPKVHTLFATAKLNVDSARALGTETWPSLGFTPNNKSVLAVQQSLTVVRSARLVALIMLAPQVTGRPRPEPLRTAEALMSLRSTAAPVVCRTTTPAAWLATAAALVRQIPAYRLPVTWELDALGLVVREIVTQAADVNRAKRRSSL